MEKSVRWGIIGLGNIARKFAKDLALVPEAKLTAIASRSLDKAKEFSETIAQEPQFVFDTYEELLQCHEVDVVYIATPHHVHAYWAIEAMRRGKHVLCEKPLGVNSAQVKEMIQAARQNKVFLMEGMWTRFNPSLVHIKSLMDNKELGPVHFLQADFAFHALDRDMNSRVWHPELAGGALLDIGIYPVFLAYLILGIPDTIMAKAQIHPNGVDRQVAMTFHYSSADAQLFCSFCGTSEMQAEILGEKGRILIHPRWHETDGFTWISEESETYQQPTLGKGYTYEIQAVHEALQHGWQEHPFWTWKNSQELIELLDRIRTKIGLKYPFETGD